jgi:hypothetical protein
LVLYSQIKANGRTKALEIRRLIPPLIPGAFLFTEGIMKKVFFVLFGIICSGWAWAGDELDVKADFTDMPLANIIAIGVGIVVILTSVVVLSVWAIKKLNIRKLGPVRMLEEQQQKNDQHNKSISCLHYMDDEIDEIDNNLRMQCHQIILEYSSHIRVVLREITSDNSVSGSMIANVKVILSGSVIRNHYTRELMPERLNKYRERYLGQMEDFYKNQSAYMNAVTLPPWEDAKKVFEHVLDEWIKRIKQAVIISCEEKIEVYDRYKNRFKEGDPWLTVCQDCREKNVGYIKALGA